MRRFWIIPSCGEVHEGLTEFTEGALPARERWGYRIHFLLCSACRNLLKAFRALPARVRRVLAPPDPAPPEAEAALGKVLLALNNDNAERRG